MNLKLFALAAVALSLSGCGKLVDMSRDPFKGVERRVYLNDAAPNDSLPSVAIDGGVYFVMQPGKKYQLRVATTGVGEQLTVLRARGDYYYGWKTFSPVIDASDSARVYELESEAGDSTRYYRAVLQSATGGKAVRPTGVKFVPAGTAPATASLRVKVVMLRQLTGLPEAQRAEFADSLLASLTRVYAAYGVMLTGSREVLEPSGDRYVADFGTGNVFPGTRDSNTAYLYVVDNVRLDGSENPNVLGFAPREGFSLLTDAVVLNIRGMGGAPGASMGVRAAPLAVTAAHELGHLFGLRHTTASGADREADFDKSNTHDGFAPLSQRCVGSLLKRGSAVAEAAIHAPDGRHYCLRTAAVACGGCPDEPNLMFAYQCPVKQESMASGQINLLRWNVSLFQY